MKKYFVLLAVLLFSINISAQNNGIKSKVTFVELGSVNCIPCKQMQPVMKAIEEKYGDQVNVVFYDVWKEDQKKICEAVWNKINSNPGIS